MSAPARTRTPFGPGREFERIRSILEGLPELPGDVEIGPGDDAAALSNGTVLSTDLAIEGVHFRLDWISPSEVGYRTAAAGVSDLAAMGAEPVGILASIGVHGDGSAAEAVMDGVRDLAGRHDLTVLGGDLTRSPGPLVLDIVSVGRGMKLLRRSGAEVGDELWVTGTLGAAAAAVALWKAGREVLGSLREAFAAPRPRVDEARWLREKGARAAIDLSDGLAGDAAHLAAASQVGIVLDLTSVPTHPGLQALSLPDGAQAIDVALHGGDDFELLIGAPAGRLEPHRDEFTGRFGVPLTRVGRVTEGSGVLVRRLGREELIPLTRGGYDHFGADGAQ